MESGEGCGFLKSETLTGSSGPLPQKEEWWKDPSSISAPKNQQ